MTKGVVRKIDHLGRITLPKEYRNTFRMDEKAPIGMYLENKQIRLVKADEKFLGIVRELDELGRLTLPIEIRRTLGFRDRQEVDMYIDCDAIIVAKYGKECAFCGADHDLLEVDGANICLTCAYKLMAKMDKLRERKGSL